MFVCNYADAIVAMALQQLSVRNLRNLQQFSITLNPHLNLIVGDNGSGKTSFLEAIHLLTLARSFRTRINKYLVQHEQEALQIFGQMSDGTQLGVEKTRRGKTRIKVNQEDKRSAVELIEQTPVLLVNPDSYKLLDAGPQNRRQFLNWGVFHVKHSFLPLWQRLQKAVKQRNAALKSGVGDRDIQLWDEEIVNSSLAIDCLRKDYLEEFIPIFHNILKKLLEVDLQLDYYPGWDADCELGSVLQAGLMRDRSLGYTQSGAHRVDLRFKVGNVAATMSLSRGQQKMVVYALKLAQMLLLKQKTDKDCLFLIDDLPSELDLHRQELLFSLLGELQAQVFVTAIDVDQVISLLGAGCGSEVGGGTDRSSQVYRLESGVIV